MQQLQATIEVPPKYTEMALYNLPHTQSRHKHTQLRKNDQLFKSAVGKRREFILEMLSTSRRRENRPQVMTGGRDDSLLVTEGTAGKSHAYMKLLVRSQQCHRLKLVVSPRPPHTHTHPPISCFHLIKTRYLTITA